MRERLIGVIFLLAGVAMTALCLAMVFDVVGKQMALDNEQAAIRAVLDSQTEAWNRGDLEAFMDGYQRSSDLTFYTHQGVEQGWDAVLDRFRSRYQKGSQSMGTLKFDELRIELVSPDTAIARGRYQLLAAQPSQGLFTLLLRKSAAGWRITHDHTSEQK